MSDLTLRQTIMDELEFEPSIDAAHIGVTVKDGVVTLSGHVGSYAEKLAAEHAVKRVKGVRAFAQEIEVRFPSDKKTADDEIAKRAVNILQWSAGVPAGSLMVKVQNGWVTLSGELPWQYQRSAAESEIRRLTGVKGVTNNITTKPHVQPADVRCKIEAALKRNAEVESGGIRIIVEGDRVVLEGSVRAWREKEVVENAAWSVPGVSRVDDRLMII